MLTGGIDLSVGAVASMAGFVTAQLAGHHLEACVRRAVVTAGFALEAWGPDGLLVATRSEAEARLAAWDPTEVRS